MENNKIECGRIFVMKEIGLAQYESYNFYVKKEDVENLYLFTESICRTYNYNYKLIGFSKIEKNVDKVKLVDKKEIFEKLTNLEYQDEEENEFCFL